MAASSKANQTILPVIYTILFQEASSCLSILWLLHGCFLHTGLNASQATIFFSSENWIVEVNYSIFQTKIEIGKKTLGKDLL